MGNNTDSQLVNCLCAHGIETTVPTLSTYIIFGIVGTILTRNQHKLKTNIKEIYRLGKKKTFKFHLDCISKSCSLTCYRLR